MEIDSLLDSIIFIITILLFLLPIMLNFANQPIEVQLVPVILFAVPIAIAIYKKRLRARKAERQKIVDKAEKMRPLLVKLERFKAAWSIGEGLTYDGKFIEDRLALLGWRKYFESQGKYLDEEHNWFVFDLDGFVSEPSRQRKTELHRKFQSFYKLVSSFRKVYDSLERMMELVEKDIPDDKLRDIQELQEDCEDFFRSLKGLCDEDDEIGSFFKGRYPLLDRPKMIIKE